MTIKLTPEIETAIAEQAQRRGMTPELLVSESLHKLFATPALTPDEILGFDGHVYAGFSKEEIDVIEEMRRTTTNEQGVSLSDYGISPAQAAELRASFATFAGEWERPEMDVYDDYDAAKARLEANPAYAEVQA